MTKTELVERLKKLKKQISEDFFCASSEVNELYYSLVYDIENSDGDITDDRKEDEHIGMTVGELIEELETYPRDARVVLPYNEDTVRVVEIRSD